MVNVSSPEFRDSLGMVVARTIYSNFVVTIFTSGIQCFMAFYCVTIFLETPKEARKGRIPYIVIGCMIFVVYTLGACTDVSIPFDVLLKASNGIEFTNEYSMPDWRDYFSLGCLTLLLIIGDGVMLYRCYLILSGNWRWLIGLPLITYLGTIALSIYHSVILFQDKGPALFNAMEGTRVALSVITNILITSFIAFRLINAHRHLSESLNSQRVAVYKTAAHIVIESALPLAIAGILYAALLYADMSARIRRVDVRGIFAAGGAMAALYYAFLAISPQMIIFRVTTGRSWMKPASSSSDSDAFSRSLAFTRGVPAEQSLYLSNVGDDSDAARDGSSNERSDSDQGSAKGGEKV